MCIFVSSFFISGKQPYHVSWRFNLARERRYLKYLEIRAWRKHSPVMRRVASNPAPARRPMMKLSYFLRAIWFWLDEASCSFTTTFCNRERVVSALNCVLLLLSPAPLTRLFKKDIIAPFPYIQWDMLEVIVDCVCRWEWKPGNRGTLCTSGAAPLQHLCPRRGHIPHDRGCRL